MPSGSFPSSICSTIVGDSDVSCKIRLTCVRSTLFAAAISSMLLYLPDSSWSCQSQALRSARDYAFDTKEKYGAAQLLPRPAISLFCQQAGIKPHDFSRCIDDESARELKVYWGMTENLDQIMSFRKKASGRNKPTNARSTELSAGYRG
jgi:hypothetical protein